MRLFSVAVLATVTLVLQAGQTLACETYAYGGLGQSWPKASADFWYDQSQGSRLMPDTWYRALKRADDGTPFAARPSMAAYGFRYCDDKAIDPIGFVMDADDTRPAAIGLNCAACHTGVLNREGTDYIVHGGAAAMDFQGFTRDLVASVNKTYVAGGIAPQPEWQAFATAVLGADYSQEAQDKLQSELRTWLAYRAKIQDSINEGGNWGHGRQDAVGVILNTVAMLSGPRADDLLPSATAPVSIPSAWNGPRTERVQWNGSSFKATDIGLIGNISSGALVRNISEAIGVFAQIDLPPADKIASATYPVVQSSIRVANLVWHERALAKLTAPQWPESWPELDRSSADYKAGETLYTQHCAGCHSRLDRAKPEQEIVDATGLASPATPFVRVLPAFAMPDTGPITVETDPMTACNALTHNVWAGKFSQFSNVFGGVSSYYAKGLGGVTLAKFGPEEQTLGLIADLSLRVIFEKSDEILQVENVDLQTGFWGLLDAITGGKVAREGDGSVTTASIPTPTPRPTTHALKTLEEVRSICAEVIAKQRRANPATLWPGYKAGPHAGVFATAPYLHNGSVPTLYDMLSPDQRPDSFMVGQVSFDPVKVGLGAPVAGGVVSEFRVRDAQGNVIPGNSNQGHAFPKQGLTEAEKTALIAYMRGL